MSVCEVGVSLDSPLVLEGAWLLNRILLAFSCVVQIENSVAASCLTPGTRKKNQGLTPVGEPLCQGFVKKKLVRPMKCTSEEVSEKKKGN